MPRKKKGPSPILKCPQCGGPVIGAIHFRSYCVNCGHRPYPVPKELALLSETIEAIDPDKARAKIAEELKDSPVTFDPTHPSNL